MKTLSDILYGTPLEDLVGNAHIAIERLTADSRKVRPFSLFFAHRGLTTDGHLYIEEAIQKGANAIICQNLPEKINPSVTWVVVRDTRRAMADVARNFYDDPSAKIKLIGVTGTNGKTTTTTLLYNLFSALGFKCGLISTVRIVINGESQPTTHTTPDILRTNELLAHMVQQGCAYAFMEVSSIGVHQGRIDGLKFTGGIFTNITHDHLDYHGTFEHYLQSKKAFIDALSPEAFALANLDDPNGPVMLQNTKARKAGYSLHGKGEFTGRIREMDLSGMLLEINGKEVWLKLTGQFNAYNVLAVYGAAQLLGTDSQQCLTVLSSLEPVEGRFNVVPGPGRTTAIIDYAHTPDALHNIMEAVRHIMKKGQRLVVLVGCGGNRDKEKRPLMGKIAVTGADVAFFTSDNPRFEDPLAIIEDMKKGLTPEELRKVHTVPDRREAIRLAASLLKSGDVLLVAGKGHEDYQEIRGEKYPFHDKKEVAEALMQYNTQNPA
ncbi:MAG: UDP-N-acetylmuramoyl-L-alanyl-D-glutamate--2,6-diaminopimelate ligase [Flavobacteriales bacterium]|nr:UDP-N-acetylmuramoyl-L-alanyl-D-glutamate--2,6-diaminopimelate ligase [Flavobacteriales bacterium]MCX7649961.1 UDP-N-acetylmuramoyl-L-alanyl-D-glutamate--2,6-diaminopimelate ligase [Flavobacteriales bacterium]MDW8432320.1 UDP-N-acetylmuramoyl-L-alanyl-D-glutamate--2,6-diaminopimelate ligase [Flavobacteriales bacterium]